MKFVSSAPFPFLRPVFRCFYGCPVMRTPGACRGTCEDRRTRSASDSTGTTPGTSARSSSSLGARHLCEPPTSDAPTGLGPCIKASSSVGSRRALQHFSSTSPSARQPKMAPARATAQVEPLLPGSQLSPTPTNFTMGRQVLLPGPMTSPW
jgi:hypothetical protein